MFYRDLLLRGVLWSDKLGKYYMLYILGSAMYNILKKSWGKEICKFEQLIKSRKLLFLSHTSLENFVHLTTLPFNVSMSKSESAIYLSKKDFPFLSFCLNKFNFPSSSEIPAISGLNFEAFIVLHLRTSSVLQGHRLFMNFCFITQFVFILSLLSHGWGKTEEWILGRHLTVSACIIIGSFLFLSSHAWY